MVEIERRASRLLVRDREGAVLLIQGVDPARPESGAFWFTPGGGREPGETELDAAIRELREETGLEALPRRIDVDREVTFAFEDCVIRQQESWFVVDVERFEPDTRGWTQQEQRTHRATRWWTAAELETTTETVYPADLASLLADLDRTPPAASA